ncbi:hypothetical protein [Dielma fastidiosa]|uniref:Uncharacterized protein n=1 Tax=Dielma fastidiosa TaxID=1034346 RepID=A0AB35UKU4_9FIRM|nr:hypothetical protein [Dielma fastidiosa]MDY5167323.1 hypothetical protein [Dielma fastidiosa]
MVKNKYFYKFILVMGLLLTMIFTLSFTQSALVHASETPIATDTDTSHKNPNNRFEFDAGMLEEARRIINGSSELDNSQLTQLHQIGFTDTQIELLIEITKNPCAADIDELNKPDDMRIVLPFLFILAIIGVGYTYHKAKPSH